MNARSLADGISGGRERTSVSEFRQNLVTGEWVIIAAERANRPEDFNRHAPKQPLPRHNPKCPFCTGNEHLTPPEIIADRPHGSAPDGDGWQVRCIPNKFPALDPDAEADWFEESRFFHGVQGFGMHEVIIDHPRHDLTIATMSRSDVERIFHIYRDRYRTLERDERILLINIFRNYGVRAGASLEHPHSQLIATPVLPTRIQHRFNVAREHYDIHGSCVMCDVIENTIENGKRVIIETEHFLAVAPFGSQTPFETWVMPRRHNHSFGNATDEEINDLASVMRDVLYRLYHGVGDPDYNYLIQASPGRTRYVEQYHWFVQILPRVVPSVGFELTSGIYICTARPEDTALFLKDQPGPPED